MTVRVLLVLAFTASASAAQPPMPDDDSHTTWRQHDLDRPAPPRVEPGPASAGLTAPADATVLIPADGGSLAAWESHDGGPARWRVADGAVVVEPGAGGIRTREAFGDVQLHLEWRAADEPEKTGQDRSNSGVFFLDGRYEVQILDTYANATYPDGAAGALYGQFPPLANALRPPDEWQAYDVFFRSPRFTPDGALVEPARLSVLVNGVLVQNNEALAGPTMWLETLPYTPHPRRGAIGLQDHGSPVRFRNVWVRDVPDRPAPPPGYGRFEAVDLTDAELDRLVGTYARPGDSPFVIERTADGLGLSMRWRPGVLRLIPVSPTTFELANTAGRIDVTLDEEGLATGLVFTMGGATYPATRE